jgi:hypothetical protein
MATRKQQLKKIEGGLTCPHCHKLIGAPREKPLELPAGLSGQQLGYEVATRLTVLLNSVAARQGKRIVMMDAALFDKLREILEVQNEQSTGS